MKNTQPHIKRDKTQTRQLPKLQLLKLEQLEGVAGGPLSGEGAEAPPGVN